VELTDRVALITGGRRIGSVIATELARKGADVSIVYRSSREEAEETALAVRAMPRRAFVLQADLQQPDACRRVVDDTVREFGRLDVLVNMASVYREKSVDALTVQDWDTQLHVDLRAAWLCSQAAIPHMRRQGGGRIVNVSSMVSKNIFPFLGAYASTKYALNALSLTARKELERDNIIVSLMLPGLTATDFGKHSILSDRTGELMQSRSQEGLPQADTPEYVAERILQAIVSGEAEVTAH